MCRALSGSSAPASLKCRAPACSATCVHMLSFRGADTCVDFHGRPYAWYLCAFCMSICLHDSASELMTLKSIPRSITHADPHPPPGMHQKLPSQVPMRHLVFSQDAEQETWAETIVMRMGLSWRRRLRDSTCLSQQMSTVKPLRL
jgi:hypothetical protein